MISTACFAHGDEGSATSPNYRAKFTYHRRDPRVRGELSGYQERRAAHIDPRGKRAGRRRSRCAHFAIRASWIPIHCSMCLWTCSRRRRTPFRSRNYGRGWSRMRRIRTRRRPSGSRNNARPAPRCSRLRVVCADNSARLLALAAIGLRRESDRAFCESGSTNSVVQLVHY